MSFITAEIQVILPLESIEKRDENLNAIVTRNSQKAPKNHVIGKDTMMGPVSPAILVDVRLYRASVFQNTMTRQYHGQISIFKCN